MLVVAALVPDTALLVPGAAGDADVLVGLRTAAVEAVTEVVDAQVGTIVVVAPGPVPRELAGTVRPSLGAAGVPDELVWWPVEPVTLPGAGHDVPAVASAVGLHLLARARRDTGLRVVEVTGRQTAEALTILGRTLVGDGPTGLVIVGSGSGRHGPDAPLADDARAPSHDARVLADLAAELAVRGWAPWQVLLGAAADQPIRARLLAETTELGAQHQVLVWDAR